MRGNCDRVCRGQPRRIPRRAGCALAALLALAVRGATAQSVEPDPADLAELSLELARPSAIGGRSLTPTTLVVFLSGSRPLRDGLRLVAELPLAHAATSRSGGPDDGGSAAIGNPYIGVVFDRLGEAGWAEAGLRLPFGGPLGVNDLASAVGGIADLGRLEAFLPDLLSVRGVYGLRRRAARNLELSAYAGSLLAVDIGRAASDDPGEWIIDYGAAARYNASGVRLDGGIIGRLSVADVEAGLGDRVIHQIGLAASTERAGFRPGLALRLPLDRDLGDAVGFTVGLRLDVRLR